jgi:TPR repeat protein
MILHYHRSVRRIPHADAAAAYLSALAAAFFGQYDRARQELEPVDWDATTPTYRGYRLYVLATLALLEETDYPKALQLARQASELSELRAIDDVIHTVADAPDEEMLARLAKVAKRQNGLMPGMCAWALALHYKRVGDPEKAADFKEMLRMSVPFSAPMLKAQ